MNYNERNVKLFFYLNLTYLIIYLIPGLFVLFKYKLDRSAVVTILIYVCAFLLKTVIWLACLIHQMGTNEGDIIEELCIIDIIISFIIQLVLTYFVFEMNSVYILLKSESPVENKIGQDKLDRKRKIIVSFQLLGNAVILVFSVMKYIYQMESLDAFSVNNLLFLTAKIFCLVIEMLIFFMFIRFITFFGRRKIRNLYAEGRDLGCKHYSYFTWIATLILINFIYIVCKCFLKTIISLLDVNSVFFFGENQRFILESTVDVINGVSMLFMFYRIGKLNHIKEKESQNQNLSVQSRPNYNTVGIVNILTEAPSISTNVNFTFVHSDSQAEQDRPNNEQSQNQQQLVYVLIPDKNPNDKGKSPTLSSQDQYSSNNSLMIVSESGDAENYDSEDTKYDNSMFKQFLTNQAYSIKGKQKLSLQNKMKILLRKNK